eukprot:1875777-Amphidinium_carterae.2
MYHIASMKYSTSERCALGRFLKLVVYGPRARPIHLHLLRSSAEKHFAKKVVKGMSAGVV